MTKKNPIYNRVQIYDLDKLLLLDISCEKCIKWGYCSRSKHRRSHCEINDVVTESGVFDIARSAIQKIREQYSR